MSKKSNYTPKKITLYLFKIILNNFCIVKIKGLVCVVFSFCALILHKRSLQRPNWTLHFILNWALLLLLLEIYFSLHKHADTCWVSHISSLSKHFLFIQMTCSFLNLYIADNAVYDRYQTWSFQQRELWVARQEHKKSWKLRAHSGAFIFLSYNCKVLGIGMQTRQYLLMHFCQLQHFVLFS